MLLSALQLLLLPPTLLQAPLQLTVVPLLLLLWLLQLNLQLLQVARPSQASQPHALFPAASVARISLPGHPPWQKTLTHQTLTVDRCLRIQDPVQAAEERSEQMCVRGRP